MIFLPRCLPAGGRDRRNVEDLVRSDQAAKEKKNQGVSRNGNGSPISTDGRQGKAMAGKRVTGVDAHHELERCRNERTINPGGQRS